MVPSTHGVLRTFFLSREFTFSPVVYQSRLGLPRICFLDCQQKSGSISGFHRYHQFFGMYIAARRFTVLDALGKYLGENMDVG